MWKLECSRTSILEYICSVEIFCPFEKWVCYLNFIVDTSNAELSVNWLLRKQPNILLDMWRVCFRQSCFKWDVWQCHCHRCSYIGTKIPLQVHPMFYQLTELGHVNLLSDSNSSADNNHSPPSLTNVAFDHLAIRNCQKKCFCLSKAIVIIIYNIWIAEHWNRFSFQLFAFKNPQKAFRVFLSEFLQVMLTNITSFLCVHLEFWEDLL